MNDSWIAASDDLTRTGKIAGLYVLAFWLDGVLTERFYT